MAYNVPMKSSAPSLGVGLYSMGGRQVWGGTLRPVHRVPEHTLRRRSQNHPQLAEDLDLGEGTQKAGAVARLTTKDAIEDLNVGNDKAT